MAFYRKELLYFYANRLDTDLLAYSPDNDVDIQLKLGLAKAVPLNQIKYPGGKEKLKYSVQFSHLLDEKNHHQQQQQQQLKHYSEAYICLSSDEEAHMIQQLINITLPISKFIQLDTPGTYVHTYVHTYK